MLRSWQTREQTRIIPRTTQQKLGWMRSCLFELVTDFAVFFFWWVWIIVASVGGTVHSRSCQTPYSFGYFTILYQVWHWKHVLRMQCRVTVYAPLGRQSPTKNQIRNVVARSNLHIADWKKKHILLQVRKASRKIAYESWKPFKFWCSFSRLRISVFFFETWTWIPGSPICFRDVFQRCSGKASHCGNGVRNCMWRQQKPNTCRMTSLRVAGGFFPAYLRFWGEVFFIPIFLKFWNLRS